MTRGNFSLPNTEFSSKPTELNTPLAYTKTKRERRRNKNQLAPFVAWDGEGYDDESGSHHYMLFGNSNDEYVEGESLTYKECFPLLLNSQEGVNVIYGGDYDVIMMTKGLPFLTLDRLLHSKAVHYDGYRMEWFRRKYLMLKDLTTSKSVVLYDVLSFFGTSFVNACRQYLGNTPELDAMLEMKLKRGSFTVDDESVKPYWQSELQYLVKLMEKLRELLREAGIKPRGWHGPGAVASALLSAHHIGTSMGAGSIPEAVIDVAEQAYYGGRFEQFKVGRIPNVTEYDIRSAYPKAISLLPSLEGSTWHHEEMPTGPIDPYALYLVSWDWTKVRKTTINVPGPFPWRSAKGNVYYPLKGYKSWYWGIEVTNLNYGMGNQRATFTLHEAWIPTFNECARPFQWVSEMYETRARMKREGNPAQLAVKLGMNSLYGKLAQSKGAKLNEDTGEWTKPRWHQIIWAGWITAYTRSVLFSAIMAAKGRAIAVETDAIFVDKPLELDEGPGLGQWERTDIDTILYVHSGVYYALNDGVWKLKSRGVEADRSKSAPYWNIIFKRLPETRQSITATIRRFGTNIRSTTYARWYDYSRTVELPTLASKRIHYPKLCVACVLHKAGQIEKASYADIPHNLTVPEPILGADLLSSSPYPLPWRKDVKFVWPNEWIVTELERDMEIEHHG